MSNVDLAHKTILVTDATGFIRANLSQRLLNEVKDMKVIGLDTERFIWMEKHRTMLR